MNKAVIGSLLGALIFSIALVFLVLIPFIQANISAGSKVPTRAPDSSSDLSNDVAPAVPVAALSQSPTPAPTPEPTITPAEPPPETQTPVPIAWPNSSAWGTVVVVVPTSAPPLPTATPTRKPTLVIRDCRTSPYPACSHDVYLADDLNSEERRMLSDGLEHLKNCAPDLYTFVQANVREVHRGAPVRDFDAWIRTGEPFVYLPEKGTINDPGRYIDSMRTFMSAAILVHEARHIERGAQTTEPDAYRFELQVFTPRCKPNDIGDYPYSRYDGIRRYAEWRASLPYKGEPPDNVIPPEFR